LNGGLIQATQVRINGTTPASSIANFNGGTLQATAGNTNFFIGVTVNVLSGGMVFDDNGFTITNETQPWQDGDGGGGGLIKKGAGSLYLDTANSYTGTTLVTNGLLAGIGSVAGAVVVGPAGNLGAGDAGALAGTFTINNNLTLQGKATMRINRDGSPTSDLINGVANLNYGGTLTISNLSVSALTTSDTFQLFSASGSKAGNFTSIVGSPGPGLAYSFDPASGVLSIVTGIANNPTNITFSVSGNTLSLSWPADHIGWILQSQTNNLGVGLSNNWADVAGSAAVTSTSVTMNPANPSVFYRLRHP
jgi:autotransporter-associated beta strand protein